MGGTSSVSPTIPRVPCLYPVPHDPSTLLSTDVDLLLSRRGLGTHTVNEPSHKDLNGLSRNLNSNLLVRSLGSKDIQRGGYLGRGGRDLEWTE